MLLHITEGFLCDSDLPDTEILINYNKGAIKKMSKGMFSDVHDMLDGDVWNYDSGFYANDGASDLFICFFYSDDGEQLAYLNNGHEEAIADYEVTEDELDDGTPLMLIRVGELVLGYMNDGTDWYIIDKDGNVAVAAELTEEEAEVIFDAVQD